MSYRPPFARMRQILKTASAPIPSESEPANVEVAIQQMTESVQVLEEVLMEEGVDTEQEPFEQPIEPELIEPEPELIEPELIEPEPETIESDSVQTSTQVPEYSLEWLKADLVNLANSLGVDSSGNKPDIIAALDAYYAGR